MSVLFRIRTGEKAAVEKEIESWKAAHEDATFAWQIDALVRETLADRDRDDELLKRVVERARGTDCEAIDEAHRFIQDYCRRSMHIHDLIRELVRLALDEGHPSAHTAALDRATADYRTWQEDYPELLVMGYEPVEQLLRSRIAEALAGRPTESNWRKVFEDEPTAEE